MGIVNLESLAMGTPILAFNRINQDCAIVTDKIIEDGKHGFILNYYNSNNLSEILSVGVPLINRIHEIDPVDCREQFEKRFTADLMARRYELIYNEQIETRPMGDKRALDYLETKSYHRCIDIGGVQRPFASKFVTTYVDMVRPEDWEKRYPGMYEPFSEIWDSKLIHGDLEVNEVWAELEQDVFDNGKYDFVICSHVLEHLANPEQFLKLLPFIADEGYIGIPNKVFELGRGREFSEEGLKRCGLIGTYR